MPPVVAPRAAHTSQMPSLKGKRIVVIDLLENRYLEHAFQTTDATIVPAPAVDLGEYFSDAKAAAAMGKAIRAIQPPVDAVIINAPQAMQFFGGAFESTPVMQLSEALNKNAIPARIFLKSGTSFTRDQQSRLAAANITPIAEEHMRNSDMPDLIARELQKKGVRHDGV